MTQYTHVRPKVGVKENGKPVYANKGGVTVAWNFNDENFCIDFNTAHCSEKDNFSRKRGRVIASGRLENENDVVWYEDITGNAADAPTMKEVNAYFYTLYGSE